MSTETERLVADGMLRVRRDGSEVIVYDPSDEQFPWRTVWYRAVTGYECGGAYPNADDSVPLLAAERARDGETR